MVIEKPHEMGLRSEHASSAAVGSVGSSFFARLGSLKREPGQGLDRTDRWGIFIREWAPTFFGLCIALSQYEKD